MLRLALNMLFGDRAKLAMLLVGLSFSALLMAQQSSVFFGIMTGIWWVIQRINAWTRPPPVRKRERD